MKNILSIINQAEPKRFMPTQTIQIGHADDFRATPATPDLPRWWLGERDEFETIVQFRSEIQRNDKVSSRILKFILAFTVLAVCLVWVSDAFGAIADPMAMTHRVFISACLIGFVAVCVLNYRMTRLVKDVDIYARLWVALLHAVRFGVIDQAELDGRFSSEPGLQETLRMDAAVAAKYAASADADHLVPRLSLFGSRFSLLKN